MLARRWAAVAPQLEVVDIDSIRRTLELWPSEPELAGREARRVALGVIADHLARGRSVVVPQFLARVEFISQLASVALSAPAQFVECVLTIGRQDAIDAFIERSEDPQVPEHADADVLVDARDRPASLAAMYDALASLVEARPTTRRIEVSRNDVSATLARVRAMVPEV